jgi:hypothetical protein
MSVRTRIVQGAIALWIATAAIAPALGTALHLSVTEIIEKNATARGGLKAWRKVETMAWAGHASADGRPVQSVPFVLEQKRPNSTRFALMVQNQRAVRVFDGTNGWKLRPGEGGMPELKPYTEEESRFARDSRTIEGPLMDDVANGATITLGRMESVDGRKAYAMNAQLPSGAAHRIWVDADSYLETRFDRDIHRTSGGPAVVSVRYRDYKAFEGLQLPTTIETSAEKGKASNKLVIERVALNPPMDARRFAKPEAPPPRHRGVSVDTRAAATPARP